MKTIAKQIFDDIDKLNTGCKAVDWDIYIEGKEYIKLKEKYGLKK